MLVSRWICRQNTSIRILSLTPRRMLQLCQGLIDHQKTPRHQKYFYSSVQSIQMTELVYVWLYRTLVHLERPFSNVC
jgi:hypothetical protein